MAKRDYFLIIDTETTQDQLVADFGAIIVDKKGKIYSQCAVLVNGIYTDQQNHPLFFDASAAPDALWSRKSADRRYANYDRLIAGGSRMLASVAAINRWLDKAKATYNPILTAYNLPFDTHKCSNTAIDLTMFDRSFCLWAAAFTAFAHTKNYREMVLALHAFNAPTSLQNMTYKTNAETMARFVLGQPTLEDEPHTALEDAVYYELPILVKVCKKLSTKKLLGDLTAYDWNKVQVKDWFSVK